MKAKLNTSTPRRLAAFALLVPVMAGMLAGCGRATGGASASRSSASGRGAKACDASQLQIIVDPSAGHPRAQGGRYVPIDFINKSKSKCQLNGYPNVVAMSTTGQHNAVARHLRGGGKAVLLGPYYTAHTWLLVADAPPGQSAGCRAFSATGLRVTPPGLPGFAWVNWPLRICVPLNQAALSVQEMHPGMANVTTYP